MKKIFSYHIYIVAFGLVLASCGNGPQQPQTAITPAKSDMVKYPEKGEMRLLTDRPPQLETPPEIFKQDITPNEYFFVRWHLAQILTKIDIDTFRLRISGAVGQPLELSLTDLQTKFAPDSMVALAICAGNSRSTFTPKVPGSQWFNGAMGNAKWKGVRLSDILTKAGVKKGAVDVTFRGLDKGTLLSIPDFVKSLSIAHAMDGEVLVAYEMNGKPIPMLNGYPLKLIVPGWYASYWVGSLASIEVLNDSFKGFWMEKAYRIAKNPQLSESPDSLSKETVPLTGIKLHSIFVLPTPGEQVAIGKPYMMDGLVYNDGTSISKVEVSADSGKTWALATLNPEIGKYSWRRWKYSWIPTAAGNYNLCVKATDSKGNTQPAQQWNRSGYARGFIEHINVAAK